ncbi:AfsR/SARP family transcriptional regulator [Kibdelosporangium phytohabitans]|nr:BTAD domain-containing putative transcriptional regulator [Kibdelosporangium phytohabitans]MBE1464081.1 DNA-binding SARP family transcriptional activator [Kibdelosporangium phytohabitans]
MGVRFRLLGTIEAQGDGGGRADLGPAMRRAVFAALLVHANRPILPDVLAEQVWGPHRPARAQDTLRSYLSRLRAALPDGPAIERDSGGYVVRVPPLEVDLHVFHELLRYASEADDKDALRLRATAFELWRGTPFSGVESPWFDGLRQSLTAELHAARLDDHDARLRDQQHAQLLPQLRLMAEAHPLDERLAGQLILALHRCGRQADAVQRYDLVRTRLVDELGVDPSAELREIRQRLLRPPTRSHTPSQLPDAPRAFTGRSAELGTIAEAMYQHGQVMLTGPGGVGKTWLAVQWANAHRGQFPDGILYVNLHGFDDSPTLTTLQAVSLLLEGLREDHAPASLDAKIALYRDAVADRRMLVVLDNARDSSQVAPLLPGGTASVVLLTSRNRLPGLVTTQGVLSVDVRPMSAADSRALLARHLGHAALAADPAAVDALIEHCRGLPLALSIIAARAAEYSLPALAAEMLAAPLDALDLGEQSADMRAVLACTFESLDQDSLAALTAFASWPATEFSLGTACALLGETPPRVRRKLRHLENSHLVLQGTADRYLLDPLVWHALHAKAST